MLYLLYSRPWFREHLKFGDESLFAAAPSPRAESGAEADAPVGGGEARPTKRRKRKPGSRGNAKTPRAGS